MSEMRISMADIAKHGDPDCKTCQGRGHLRPGRDFEAHKFRSGPQRGQWTEPARTCHCAMTRFLAKHKDDISFNGTHAIWLLGRKPKAQRASA